MYPPPYTPAQSQPPNYSPPPPYSGCTGKWTPAGGTHRELSRTSFDLKNSDIYFFFSKVVNNPKFPSGNKRSLKWCLMGFWWSRDQAELLTLNQLCTQKASHHFKGEDHCCRHGGKPHWRSKVFPVQPPKHTYLYILSWLIWGYTTGLNLSKNLNVNV